jgi:cytochrome c oxidase subunit 4
MLWEANWKYVLTIPASMMSIFLLLMLVPDIGRRTTKYAEERWLHAARPRAVSPPGESAEALGNDHNHSSDGKKSEAAKH